MSMGIVEQRPAWAEDRALLGSNPSADPGARTERRAMGSSVARLSSTPFGIGTKAKNPSRLRREPLDIQNPGDGLPVVANPERPIVRFTLNHYKSTLVTRVASRTLHFNNTCLLVNVQPKFTMSK